MGYSYDMRGRLCCDACPASGGVRKRACRFKVTCDRGLSLPYCYPPALCDECYAKHGGTKGLHGDRCREGAAARQAEYDRRRARLDAGELLRRCAWGEDGGMVGVSFEGRASRTYRRMADEVYHLLPLGVDASPEDFERAAAAAGLPAPIPWVGPDDGATTKEAGAPASALPIVEPEPAALAAIAPDLIPGTFPGGLLFPE